MIYSKKLNNEPAKMTENDVEHLREAGFDDGEILEINQVVSYFAYANRTVLFGFGVFVAALLITDVTTINPVRMALCILAAEVAVLGLRIGLAYACIRRAHDA